MPTGRIFDTSGAHDAPRVSVSLQQATRSNARRYPRVGACACPGRPARTRAWAHRMLKEKGRGIHISIRTSSSSRSSIGPPGEARMLRSRSSKALGGWSLYHCLWYSGTSKDATFPPETPALSEVEPKTKMKATGMAPSSVEPRDVEDEEAKEAESEGEGEDLGLDDSSISGQVCRGPRSHCLPVQLLAQFGAASLAPGAC